MHTRAGLTRSGVPNGALPCNCMPHAAICILYAAYCTWHVACRMLRGVSRHAPCTVRRAVYCILHNPSGIFHDCILHNPSGIFHDACHMWHAVMHTACDVAGRCMSHAMLAGACCMRCCRCMLHAMLQVHVACLRCRRSGSRTPRRAKVHWRWQSRLLTLPGRSSI